MLRKQRLPAAISSGSERPLEPVRTGHHIARLQSRSADTSASKRRRDAALKSCRSSSDQESDQSIGRFEASSASRSASADSSEAATGGRRRNAPTNDASRSLSCISISCIQYIGQSTGQEPAWPRSRQAVDVPPSAGPRATCTEPPLRDHRYLLISALRLQRSCELLRFGINAADETRKVHVGPIRVFGLELDGELSRGGIGWDAFALERESA